MGVAVAVGGRTWIAEVGVTTSGLVRLTTKAVQVNSSPKQTGLEAKF
jgi:hypothetical protein